MLGKNNWQRVGQMNSKRHYKAYKAGSHWVFATMTSLVLGAGALFGTSVTADAATTDPATETVAAKAAANKQSTDSQSPTNPATAPSVDNTNTQKLATSASDLQSAVDTAKSTGVAVTQNPSKTITTTPDKLATTADQVKADYESQTQALNQATDKQKANNSTYASDKEKYDKNEVTINPVNSGWTKEALVKLLAGKGHKTDVTDATKVTQEETTAASDEAKKAAQVTLKAGNTVTDKDGQSIKDGYQITLSGDTNPTWTYNNAFVDPATGRMISVVETISGFVPLDGATDTHLNVHTDSIGFQPYNTKSISAQVKYIYADTGEAAKIDAVVGFGDLDGNQGISVDNDYATLVRGKAISAVSRDNTVVYQDTALHTFDANNPDGQVWVLQKGISETDYTFYDGFRADGKVDNNWPLQSIGGLSFSVNVPVAPTLTTEKGSYTETTIKVATNYTVHYEGAGTATPADAVIPVNWTGTYDSATNSYTWTPDNPNINVETPKVENYSAQARAGWTLTNTTNDPANQTLTVAYQQHGQVGETDTTELIVRYVDEKGNPIYPESTTTGKIGQPFEVTAVTIPGYVPSAPTSVKGTYDGNQMTVTFVYHQVSGNPIPTTPTTPTGTTTPTPTGTTTPTPTGTPTPTQPQTPTDTQPQTPGNEPGNPTHPEENEPTVSEKKLVQESKKKQHQAPTVTSTKHVGSATKTANHQTTDSSKTATNGDAAAKLPQTGDQLSQSWTAVGVSLLGMLGLLGLTKKRRHTH
ncbi:LPXTG cell wall anchor domain-containing protein [Secundilactobacillus kimchicus]|uniref:Cell surface protein n=1 Tax=Secundilactobacillus kimchicus JCM 15530 TaxID=1302272 RepID=A0A0R1HPN7_9LACO|nr:MucBP domain-containing protein [Secundilactobacillus kimchicus]KRK48829.1 cell surface protein precursor [Secundilactobacillus kimchicus JCM 15530]MBT9671962.1 LPXTG cell wall anchor domain-containing protein [Secundilactobacillus kimchicus]